MEKKAGKPVTVLENVKADRIPKCDAAFFFFLNYLITVSNKMWL